MTDTSPGSFHGPEVATQARNILVGKVSLWHPREFFSITAPYCTQRNIVRSNTPYIARQLPLVLHSSYTVGSAYLNSIECKDGIHLREA